MDKNENTIKSIQLNTRFADNTDLTNPIWTIQPSINDIEAFKIKSLVLPISAYNIDTYNNKLKMIQNISGTTSANTITMTTQNYNSSNIGTYLTSALNSQGNLYMTATFQTASNKLCLASTTGTFYLTDTTNDVYETLGFTTSSSFVSTYTGRSCVDLSGVKVLNLQSNSLDGIDISGFNNRILGSIPIDEGVNSIASYQDDSADYIETNISNLSQISITLKDEKYREIVQRNHWSVVLNLKTG